MVKINKWPMFFKIMFESFYFVDAFGFQDFVRFEKIKTHFGISGLNCSETPVEIVGNSQNKNYTISKSVVSVVSRTWTFSDLQKWIWGNDISYDAP